MGHTTLIQWLEIHAIVADAAVFTYDPHIRFSHAEAENMRREVDYLTSCNYTKHDAELKVLLDLGYLKKVELQAV